MLECLGRYQLGGWGRQGRGEHSRLKAQPIQRYVPCGEGDPEVFIFGAFKILNIPLMGKYLIKLSVGVENRP